MKNMILILTRLIVSVGCEKKEYHIVEVDNPTYRENTDFKYSEDLSSPKFQHLIIKYQLDTIFHGEEDSS